MRARPAALAAAVLLSAAPPSAARAQPDGGLFDYTVRAGDTCAALARRFYDDRRRYDRIHRHNPDLGPPPHRLAPGTVLRLPAPDAGRASAPDARLTGVRRRVELRAPREDDWRPARVGAPLDAGWQLATRARSSAELTFRDASELDVREHTLVVIYGGSRRLAERRDVRATLERGALRSRLSELAGRLAVQTPSARTEVGRGTAVVTVAEDGTSRVSNLAGDAAEVSGGDARVRLPAGTGTVVRRGERPSAPHRLPDAPRWAQDQSGRFVGLTGSGGSLRGRFLPVEGASRYRVELAAQPDGGDVVAAVEVPAATPSFVVHRLPPGAYYLSVSTIDAELFEGPPSPRRAMQVLSARIIPPGGAEPVEEPYDPGDPSRPFHPPRVLPGTWVVAPAGMRCRAGAEGEAREMITLRLAGTITVACLDARGRPVPAFDVEVVGVGARLVAGRDAVRRNRRSTVTVELEAALPVPSRILATAPAGVTVGRPRRRPDGRFDLSVLAGPEAPRTFAIELATLAATERVPLASVPVSLGEDPPPASAPARGPPAPGLPPPPGHARPRLSSPRGLALDDLERPGALGWVASGWATARSPSVAAGLRGQIGSAPLRLGIAWRRAGHGPGGPAGSSWLLTGSWTLGRPESLTVNPTADLSAVHDEGTDTVAGGWARLSVALAWRVAPPVTLRSRPGVALGLGAQSAPSLFVPVGVDWAVLEDLSLRAELPVELPLDRPGLHGWLALGVAGRLGPVELAAGLETAFGGIALYGAVTVVSVP